MAPTNIDELKAAIAELEKRKVVQQSIMVSQFHATTDSLKPVNLIKSAIGNVIHTPEIRNSAINTVAGIGLGMLTKGMFLGKYTAIAKHVIGSAFENGIVETAKNTTDNIKAYSTAVYNNLFRRKH